MSAPLPAHPQHSVELRTPTEDKLANGAVLSLTECLELLDKALSAAAKDAERDFARLEELAARAKGAEATVQAAAETARRALDAAHARFERAVARAVDEGAAPAQAAATQQELASVASAVAEQATKRLVSILAVFQACVDERSDAIGALERALAA